MARRQCPGCGRPLPFAARRCAHCGWLRHQSSGARTARRRWLRAGAVVAMVVLVLGTVAYRIGATALGEWYAEFAMRHLPASFAALAPADTPSGAFYACVQRVARRVRDRDAVETFPGQSAENTVPVGESRYRVRSVLETVREDGERVQRSFECVVRYEGARWVVDEVAVE